MMQGQGDNEMGKSPKLVAYSLERPKSTLMPIYANATHDTDSTARIEYLTDKGLETFSTV